ncbi:hypothetical protein ACVNPZ_02675 [Staphylococcus aureus]
MLEEPNPILAVIVGAGLTALVQSSSATDWYFTRILSTRFNELKPAIPVLLGDNIVEPLQLS